MGTAELVILGLVFAVIAAVGVVALFVMYRLGYARGLAEGQLRASAPAAAKAA